MVLDVDRPVPGAPGHCDQEVGLAHPPAGEINGQPPAHDERRSGPHRAERGVLSGGAGLTGDDAGGGMKGEQLGDDPGLELPAAGEPALEHRRHRPGVGWPDEIPLSADRALLGYITALRWHARRVVATAHRPMVGARRLGARALFRPDIAVAICGSTVRFRLVSRWLCCWSGPTKEEAWLASSW